MRRAAGWIDLRVCATSVPSRSRVFPSRFAGPLVLRVMPDATAGRRENIVQSWLDDSGYPVGLDRVGRPPEAPIPNGRACERSVGFPRNVRWACSAT